MNVEEKEATLATDEQITAAAKTAFLTELKTSVEETDVVESVAIDGEDITTTFNKKGNNSDTIDGVLKVAGTLIVEFKEKATDSKITIGENEIDLTDEYAPIHIAAYLFDQEVEVTEDDKRGVEIVELNNKIDSFLDNNENKSSEYSVTITHDDVEFILDGTLNFTVVGAE